MSRFIYWPMRIIVEFGDLHICHSNFARQELQLHDFLRGATLTESSNMFFHNSGLLVVPMINY